MQSPLEMDISSRKAKIQMNESRVAELIKRKLLVEYQINFINAETEKERKKIRRKVKLLEKLNSV